MNGAKCLLDTNVVIGLLKQHTAAVALIEAHHLDLNQIAISQITRMELLGFPSLPKEEERLIQGFLQSCLVLFIDEVVERQTIHLRRSGLQIAGCHHRRHRASTSTHVADARRTTRKTR